MKKIYREVLLILILLSCLLFPTTVYATPVPTSAPAGGIKEPWEVDVQMNVTKDDGGMYTSDIKTTGLAMGDKTDTWNKVFSEYKGIIVGVSGVVTLSMVLFFILNFMKLAQSAGNPQARSQALTGLFWTGLAAAGAGGFSLFVAFSYNLLK